MIIIEDLGMVERRYSNNGVKIRQIETDTLWNDAINIKPCPYTYEETDILIPDEEIDAEEALRIITGDAEYDEN